MQKNTLNYFTFPNKGIDGVVAKLNYIKSSLNAIDIEWILFIFIIYNIKYLYKFKNNFLKLKNIYFIN